LTPLLIFVLITGLASCSDVTNTSPAEPDKETVLALNPSGDNLRNSEGSFIELSNGNILFIYTHFTGGAGDYAPAFLAGRISSDGGVTWTQEDTKILSNEAGLNTMSVSLLRLQNGHIALFYARKNGHKDCTPWMRISTDEAQTWSEPIPCITDREGYFVLNNGVVQYRHHLGLLLGR